MTGGQAHRPRAVGLFAGIGGIELGLEQAGFESALLCEIWDAAQSVLETHFAGVPLVGDVRDIDSLPEAELLAAGFPCQDLSQAGRTRGITGKNSGLVSEVFRLLDHQDPKWLLLENVPFMLQLDRGRAMAYLVEALEARGFTWAYRVVDTRAFGLPQRRQRVLLLASRSEDPRGALFADEAGEPPLAAQETVGCGFYWTEGIRGLGWAVDAVPTLKGGSGVGIPSPPAIRLPDDGGLVLPDIRDAERLQGFPADWTVPALDGRARGEGARWKMIGNAVSVPVAEWVGRRMTQPGDPYPAVERPITGDKWPGAAWGALGVRNAVDLSKWPIRRPCRHLVEFLEYPTRPLSERATAGFLSRTRRSSLRFPEGFLTAVEMHLAAVAELRAAA